MFAAQSFSASPRSSGNRKKPQRGSKSFGSSAPSSSSLASARSSGSSDSCDGKYLPVVSLTVYDSECKLLLTLPVSAIWQRPTSTHFKLARLVLCKDFDPRIPGSCRAGVRCPFLHADLSLEVIESRAVHVNYAWRSVDEVPYERLEAGHDAEVLAPRYRDAPQLIPSELLLATKGAKELVPVGRSMFHCAHYYLNRECDCGAECHFAHAIYIDPNASRYQLAPKRSGAGPLAVAAYIEKKQKEKASEDGAPSQKASSSISNGKQQPTAAPEESPAEVKAYRRNPYSLLQVTLDVFA